MDLLYERLSGFDINIYIVPESENLQLRQLSSWLILA
jgi:hypothetical protein